MLKEKSIKTEIGKVYYWINNNLPDSDVCIVFCHGLTADHSLFEKQIDFSRPNIKFYFGIFLCTGSQSPTKISHTTMSFPT